MVDCCCRFDVTGNIDDDAIVPLAVVAVEAESVNVISILPAFVEVGKVGSIVEVEVAILVDVKIEIV